MLLLHAEILDDDDVTRVDLREAFDQRGDVGQGATRGCGLKDYRWTKSNDQEMGFTCR